MISGRNDEDEWCGCVAMAMDGTISTLYGGWRWRWRGYEQSDTIEVEQKIVAGSTWLAK